MKNSKVVLSTILLVAGVITFASFKSKSYDKRAFHIVCFYYVPVESECCGILNPNNWIDALTQDPSNPVNGLCDATNFMCAICFDDMQLVNDFPDQTLLSNLYTTLNTNFPATGLPSITPATIKVSSSPDVFVNVYQKLYP